ncbi:hypothetical protein DPMN_105434 [Dreissena polymorpha]|uniref:Uncharacterized protein n=1 Tax=Dreissena polymorpha TaxID=45954 RepID=A0A9D4HGS9_DREPO|nr:hypothetical protein DPMN_105434 [Dreissena polymorpha]
MEATTEGQLSENYEVLDVLFDSGLSAFLRVDTVNDCMVNKWATDQHRRTVDL